MSRLRFYHASSYKAAFGSHRAQSRRGRHIPVGATRVKSKPWGEHQSSGTVANFPHPQDPARRAPVLITQQSEAASPGKRGIRTRYPLRCCDLVEASERVEATGALSGRKEKQLLILRLLTRVGSSTRRAGESSVSGSLSRLGQSGIRSVLPRMMAQRFVSELSFPVTRRF